MAKWKKTKSLRHSRVHQLLRLASVAFLSGILLAQGIHPVTGRRYAQVMGFGGAGWLVRPEREMEEQPDKALDALKLQPGMTAADVGCGVGYFTWRMAERVGPSGKVYGVDLQPPMLEELKKNVAARGLTNVVAVQGDVDDPKLPPKSLDLILMVDVYHEFSEPQAMLRKMREGLKPGGRMVLVEYRKEDPSVPIKPEHKMSVQDVRAEVEPEGFRFVRNIGVLPQQHILIFQPSVQ